MLIFDLETDGLLDDVSRIHCLSIYDTDTEEQTTYNTDKGDVLTGIRQLQKANTIIGHNIIGYDLPVIRKLYSWFDYTNQVLDTLVLSRIYHSNMIDLDKKHNWKFMPLQLYGRHSLESYGYRLGCYKGEFGKTSDWQQWSQEMNDYCEMDVKVTTKLWQHFLKYLDTSN